MKVYLINRADRPKRLLHALDQLRKVGLHQNVTRIEACTPEIAKQNKHTWYSERAVRNIERGGERSDLIPTWGAAACARSHMMCWRDTFKTMTATDTVLILEDDIECTDPDRFQFAFQKARRVIQQTLDDYQVIQARRPILWLFGASACDPTQPMDDTTVKIQNIFCGLHCYLCNYEAIKYLLQYIHEVDFQLDLHISKLTFNSDHQFRLCIYNTPEAGVIQSKRFSTDTQPSIPTCHTLTNMLSKHRLPEILCTIILSYLPPPSTKLTYPNYIETEPMLFQSYLDSYSSWT